MTTGNAMKMRLELSQLARRHGIETPTPNPLPLSPPFDGPLTIEGIAASANVVDSTRMRFRAYSLALPSMLMRPNPPLLYRHDPAQVAGEILSLDHDASGNLRIRALVHHELAKRAPALSVGAKINAYEIKDADTPNFFAQITNAEVTEVSLTPSPACAQSLVTRRYAQPAALKTYDLGIAGVRKCMEIVELLQKISAQPAPSSKVLSENFTRQPARLAHVSKTPTKPRPLPREPHRVGSFGALVRAIEQRAEG